MATALTLDRLNRSTRDEFVAQLDGVYEHSTWIAQQAWAQRPFATLAALKHALVQVLRGSDRATQVALIRAHPELAGKAMVHRSLTAESSHEQGASGLTHCTEQEFARLQQLNAEYNARFGWPF